MTRTDRILSASISVFNKIAYLCLWSDRSDVGVGRIEGGVSTAFFVRFRQKVDKKNKNRVRNHSNAVCCAQDKDTKAVFVECRRECILGAISAPHAPMGAVCWGVQRVGKFGKFGKFGMKVDKSSTKSLSLPETYTPHGYFISIHLDPNGWPRLHASLFAPVGR